jgi:lysozyme family protein
MVEKEMNPISTPDPWDRYIEDVIQQIIMKQEGGYVLSSDPDGGDGGFTYAGVTANTFRSSNIILSNERPALYSRVTFEATFLNPPANQDDIKNTVNVIYQSEYVPHWLIIEEDVIPPRLVGPIMSASINLGLVKATRIMQRTLGVQDDGVFGPISAKALRDSVNIYNSQLFTRFLSKWMEVYKDIVHANPVKAQYLQGWKNRVRFWIDPKNILPFPGAQS